MIEATRSVGFYILSMFIGTPDSFVRSFSARLRYSKDECRKRSFFATALPEGDGLHRSAIAGSRLTGTMQAAQVGSRGAEVGPKLKSPELPGNFLPTERISMRCLVATLLVASVAVLPEHARADEPITPEAAHAIGVDAYLYFYPLVTMDITRKQSVNIEPGKEFGKGPMNMFVNIPAYPPADLKVVVRSTSTRSIPSRGWTSPRRLRSSPRRTRTGGFTSCRCSTCGRTSSRRPAGGRPAPRRAISSSPRPAGAERSRRGSRDSRRRHRISGSSAAPRRTVRRITPRSTRFRRATKSRRSRVGARHPSR